MAISFPPPSKLQYIKQDIWYCLSESLRISFRFPFASNSVCPSTLELDGTTFIIGAKSNIEIPCRCDVLRDYLIFKILSCTLALKVAARKLILDGEKNLLSLNPLKSSSNNLKRLMSQRITKLLWKQTTQPNQFDFNRKEYIWICLWSAITKPIVYDLV